MAAVGFEDACWRPGITDEGAVELLEEASATLGDDDSALRVMLLAGLGRAHALIGNYGKLLRRGEKPGAARQITFSQAQCRHAGNKRPEQGPSPEPITCYDAGPESRARSAAKPSVEMASQLRFACWSVVRACEILVPSTCGVAAATITAASTSP